MEWFVLEWCPLDNCIDLYRWKTSKTDIGEVWTEVQESVRNLSSLLVMDRERLENLFKAVEELRREMSRKKAKKMNKKSGTRRQGGIMANRCKGVEK